VTGAPAGTRRRGQAAAGTSPRRPWAARCRGRVRITTALAAIAAAGLTLAGCSGGSPASSGSVFTARHQVSLQQVQSEITTLYGAHPGITSFAAQDVKYTTQSRDTVLRECTSAGSAAGSQDAETGQLVACAPLIFYFYSYGKQAPAPAAITVAGDLYWYAVTHITGPVSAQANLDQLLASWKLPVPGLTQAQQETVIASSVITAADDTMLTRKRVHLVIADRATGAPNDQRIVADIAAVTGSEVITYGTATATIRVTGKDAYFTGNRAGLTAYIGLSAVAAAKVGSRWVVIKAGSSEYQDLAAENTLSGLPSSILPSASDVTRVSTSMEGKQQVYIMDWKTTASGSTAAISVRLILTATPQVLPVSETLTTKGETKTLTFSGWDAPFTVATPATTIPYSQVTG
jgi:hypothetical protein